MRRVYRHNGSSRGKLDLPMTPMIDVIFLLIIFFLCTASFRPPESLLPTLLNLPGSTGTVVESDPELEDLDEIVLELTWQDGRVGWRINDQPCPDLAAVAARLQAVAEIQIDLPVILDIAPAVPMEYVIDVYDLCRSLGLQRVQFAAPADA